MLSASRRPVDPSGPRAEDPLPAKIVPPEANVERPEELGEKKPDALESWLVSRLPYRFRNWSWRQYDQLADGRR
jgi:hypothetical protein